MCGVDWYPTMKYTTKNSLIQIKLTSDSTDAKYGFALVYRETGKFITFTLNLSSQ